MDDLTEQAKRMRASSDGASASLAGSCSPPRPGWRRRPSSGWAAVTRTQRHWPAAAQSQPATACSCPRASAASSSTRCATRSAANPLTTDPSLPSGFKAVLAAAREHRLQAGRVRRLQPERQLRGRQPQHPRGRSSCCAHGWTASASRRRATTAASRARSRMRSLAQFDAACEVANILGFGHIGTGNDPTSSNYLADWQAAAERWNILGARAATHGLKLYTHNHDAAYNFLLDTGTPDALGRPTASTGIRKLEWFLQNTDPNYVYLEMDVYWAHVAQYRFQSFTAADGSVVPDVFDPAGSRLRADAALPAVPREGRSVHRDRILDRPVRPGKHRLHDVLPAHRREGRRTTRCTSRTTPPRCSRLPRPRCRCRTQRPRTRRWPPCAAEHRGSAAARAAGRLLRGRVLRGAAPLPCSERSPAGRATSGTRRAAEVRKRAQARKTACTSPTSARPPRASSSISTAVPTTGWPSSANELMRRDERAARGEHVVDEEHPGARREVVVHFDRRLAVLQHVRDGCRGPRQLARLAHRHQPDPRCHRHRAGEQEAARLDTGDDVEGAGERGDQGVDRGAQASASASSGVMSRNRMPGSG